MQSMPNLSFDGEMCLILPIDPQCYVGGPNGPR